MLRVGSLLAIAVAITLLSGGAVGPGAMRLNKTNFEDLTASLFKEPGLAQASNWCSGGVCEEWIRYLDGPLGRDHASAVEVDSSGNVYVSGFTSINETQPNGYTEAYWLLAKYSPVGEQLWSASLPAPLGYTFGYPHDVAVDSEGNVFITGAFTPVPFDLDAVTARFDADGTLAWMRLYKGGGNGSDVGSSIAIDREGAIYVTGWTQPSPSDRSDIFTVKYDGSSGAESWLATFSDSPGSNDEGGSIIVEDGAAYVSGIFTPAETDLDPYPQTGSLTIKYDATAGTLLWLAREPGWFRPEVPAGSSIAVGGAALSPDGALYVSGCAEHFTEPYVGTGYYDVLLVKYDRSNGGKIWQTEYHNEVCGGAPKTIDGAGNVMIVSGAGTGEFFSRDWLVLKFDANSGQLLWSVQYDGPAGINDSASAIASDSSGNAYVTGTTDGYDGVTIKYDGSSGRLIWVARLGQSNTTADDAHLGAIAVDSSSGVVVTGTSLNDFVTVKYIDDPAEPTTTPTAGAEAPEMTESPRTTSTLTPVPSRVPEATSSPDPSPTVLPAQLPPAGSGALGGERGWLTVASTLLLAVLGLFLACRWQLKRSTKP